MPQAIVHLLFRGGNGAAPVAGNGRHFLGGDPRNALRLAQGTPFFDTRFNHRFFYRANQRVQRGTRNKQLDQLGFRDQAQAQREGIVADITGARRETYGHVRQAMAGVDMGKIVKGALAGRNIQPTVSAAAQ
ncbi:hypothetical protein D3C81_1624210 [compost metagenome]